MEQEKPRGITVSVAPATFRMTPVGFALFASTQAADDSEPLGGLLSH